MSGVTLRRTLQGRLVGAMLPRCSQASPELWQQVNLHREIYHAAICTMECDAEALPIRRVSRNKAKHAIDGKIVAEHLCEGSLGAPVIAEMRSLIF